MPVIEKGWNKFRTDGVTGVTEAGLRRMRNQSILTSIDVFGRDYVSLQSLSDRDDIQSIHVYPEESVTVDPPEGVGPIPNRYENFGGRHYFPAASVSIIPDVMITGETPVVVSDKGEFIYDREFKRRKVGQAILDSCQHGCPAHRLQKFLGRDSFTQDSEIEVGCLLVGAGDTNFHHWTCHYLTVFQAIQQYEERTNRKPTIIIPKDASSYHYETLSQLGYGDDNLMTWDGQTTKVNRYVFPTVRYKPAYENWMLFSPSALAWLATHMKEAIADTSHSYSENVYISRADATERQILNEEALLEVLGDLGFESYVLSSMSIEQQIQLFAQAENIVGPHGAGLTNIIYADDSRILELVGPDDSDIKVGPHYFGLANSLGLDYRYYICEADGGDMIADPDRIREYIRDWMF